MFWFITLAACSNTSDNKDPGGSASADRCAVEGDRPVSWTEDTHGADAAPAYETVLDAGRVHALNITVDPEDYAFMYTELTELTGSEFGSGGSGVDALPDEFIETAAAACEGSLAGDACTLDMMGTSMAGTCTAWTDGLLLCFPDDMGGDMGGDTGGDMGGGMGGEGGLEFLSEEPSYVPVTVEADDQAWCQVGMRFKGNATLSQTWSLGVGKLPFRLDFDELEEDHPEIDGQRFYGFQKLAFGNGQGDATLLREVLASEILADRGVPVARSAFYRITVDAGEGPVYWGLYTATEDPSDAMLDRVFGEDAGNLYKPDGSCANLTCFDEESFEKKSNEGEADWADIEAFVAALNADRSDPAAWRAGLEATLDVQGFLRWLAVNSAMENWDTYGGMAHNYYLYGATDDSGRLVWIPWDHNLSMMPGLVGDSDPMLRDTSDSWPLIRFVLDDPEYGPQYEALLAEAVTGAYAEERFNARVAELQLLVEPYLFGDEGEVAGFTFLTDTSAWQSAVDDDLIGYAVERRASVAEALSEVESGAE